MLLTEGKQTMRLTEALDWMTNPNADSGRYTHFDPTLSVDGGCVIDCTGEPELFLPDTPVVDFGERRPFVESIADGLCAADLAQYRLGREAR